MLSVLGQYFDSFDDDNRRLNALHNVVRKLRRIGNEYQATIASTDRVL